MVKTLVRRAVVAVAFHELAARRLPAETHPMTMLASTATTHHAVSGDMAIGG